MRHFAFCLAAFALVFVAGPAVEAQGSKTPTRVLESGHEPKNQLLLTHVGVGGNITILQYRDGDYLEVWDATTPEVYSTRSGGEAGDLTGDGVLEFAFSRSVSSSEKRLEVWSFDEDTQGWVQLWVGPVQTDDQWVGEIFDADNDGVNELLVTDEANNQLVLYSYNGTGFEVEAVVHECTGTDAYFISTAGDLNGNGTPEILFQCYQPDDLSIFEHVGGNTYQIVGSIPLPPGAGTNPMIVDDMEVGDVNGDGLVDAVFCGNSRSAHVVTFDVGIQDYILEYTSPPSALFASQTCSVGDVTNDGLDDILVVSDQARVYTYDGLDYQEVWAGGSLGGGVPIGASFVGDADNDGFTEFLFGSGCGLTGYDNWVSLFENDVVGASNFQNTFTFSGIFCGMSSIIIAPLIPSSIFADGFESDDTSAWDATVP